MMATPRSFLFAVLAPALAAQTLIVDAANGPGTNYTDLPPAVAYAPDGATLLVRPGSYSGFAFASKGLTILADAGATVHGAVTITTTTSGQSVTLRGIVFPQGTYAPVNLLYLADCAGPVLVDGCSIGTYPVCNPASGPTCFSFLTGFYAAHCAQLALRSCTFLGAADLYACTTVIDACTIRSEDYGVAGPGHVRTVALGVSGGVATLTGNTVVRGGDGCCIGGLYTTYPGNGIFNSGADLRLLSGSVAAGTAGGSTVYTFAVLGSGARVSPRFTLTDSSGTSTGTTRMPELRGNSTQPGGALTATVTTENGDLAVLAIGFPRAPRTIAGMHDPFWLDPNLNVFVAIGIQQQGAPITGSAAVPNSPAFRGLRLNWQAACQGPVTGLQATNPVVAVVR